MWIGALEKCDDVRELPLLEQRDAGHTSSAPVMIKPTMRSE